MSRLRRVGRPGAAAALVTALTATASGCVTVHGEREIVPSATKAEAADALRDFTEAYNKAERDADPDKDAKRVTGPFGAINQAALKARAANEKKAGARKPTPLKLTDAKFTIPKQKGWPRWFVADTDSNKDTPQAPFRWMMVFTKGSATQEWEASYLALVAPGKVPEFKKDKDGWAQPVPVDDPSLAARPKDLSESYAAYLKKGGEDFAPGTHTSEWRVVREKNANRPGIVTQYIDQQLNSGDFAPVGLRTDDGGALVFFSTRHFEKRTAASGLNLRISDDVRALMRGDAKSAVTLEFAAGQTALVPAKDAESPAVQVLNRVQGLTGAKGE